MSKLTEILTAYASQLRGSIRLVHISLIFFFVALFIRLPGLSTLPPFVDESVNLGVSSSPQLAAEVDPVGLGRPLLKYEFRPICTMWALVGRSCEVPDARYFVALVGALSTVLISLIAGRLWGGSAAAVAGMLYALSPFMWAHERLLLQDPITTLLLLLGIYCGFGIRSSSLCGRILLAGVIGVFLALAFLNKLTAVISFPWVFAALLLALPADNRLRVGVVFVSGLTALAMALLILRESIWVFGARLVQFGHPPEILAQKAAVNFELLIGSWLNSLGRYGAFQFEYNGWFFLPLLVCAAVFSIRSHPALRTLRLMILISLLIGIVMYSARGYARYFHPEMVPLFLLISALYEKRPGTSFQWALSPLLALAICSWVGTRVQFQVLAPSSQASALGSDYSQYSSSWYDGQGLSDLRSEIMALGSGSPAVVVFTGGYHSAAQRDLELFSLIQPSISVIPLTLDLQRVGEAIGARCSTRNGSRALCFYVEETTGAGADRLGQLLREAGGRLEQRATIQRTAPYAFNLFEVRVDDLVTLAANLQPSQLQLGMENRPAVVQPLRATAADCSLVIRGHLPPVLARQYPRLTVAVAGEVVFEDTLSERFDLDILVRHLNLEGEAPVELRIDRWLLRYAPEVRDGLYPNVYVGSGAIFDEVSFSTRSCVVSGVG